MVRSTTTSKWQYNGNDVTTAFPYNARIDNAAHMEVIITDASEVETILTLNTHYTVDGVGTDSGGNVNYPISGSPLPTGSRITIRLMPVLTQEVDLSNQGGFFQQTHENVFDYLTLIAQYLQEQIDRCVKIPVSSLASATYEALLAVINAAVASTSSSETNAAASAASASTSETNAAASAAAAAVSETNAAASAAEAGTDRVNENFGAYDAKTSPVLADTVVINDSAGSGGVAEHVVTDRTTATKYGIAISDSELNYDTSAGADDGEPILEDQNNPGNYYKVFVDDGELGVESTATVQDDLIVLEDTVTATNYRLVIRDGELATVEYTDVVKEVTLLNILKLVYPVGSVYANATNSANPATLLGFGTWVAIAGEALVGYQSGDPDFGAVGSVAAGEKTHTLSIAEMPSHNHSQTGRNNNGWNLSDNAFQGSSFAGGSGTLTTGSRGSGDAHNNIQPSYVVYLWRRTA